MTAIGSRSKVAPLSSGSDAESAKMNPIKDSRIISTSWYKEHLHETEMELDEFAKNHFFKTEKAKDRFLDKLTFLMTVTGTCCLTFCISSEEGRAFIPWMYTLSLPPLMLIRWFQYKKRKWTYFMLDFCYVADLLLWINMIFLPQSKYLFLVIFSVGCGPLAGAVIMYRNSLVFHSIDKFSSAYIHVMPMACCYALRWHPAACSTRWHTEFVTGGIEEEVADYFDTSNPELYIAIFTPLVCTLFFLVQNVFEIFFLYKVTAMKCARRWFKFHDEEGHLTLYRYSVMSAKPGSIMHAVLWALGPNRTFLSFFIGNQVFTLLSTTPSYLLYTYWEANMIYALIVYVYATWSGACFYIEVFSHKYASKDTFKAKMTEPVDENVVKVNKRRLTTLIAENEALRLAASEARSASASGDSSEDSVDAAGVSNANDNNAADAELATQ